MAKFTLVCSVVAFCSGMCMQNPTGKVMEAAEFRVVRNGKVCATLAGLENGAEFVLLTDSKPAVRIIAVGGQETRIEAAAPGGGGKWTLVCKNESVRSSLDAGTDAEVASYLSVERMKGTWVSSVGCYAKEASVAQVSQERFAMVDLHGAGGTASISADKDSKVHAILISPGEIGAAASLGTGETDVEATLRGREGIGVKGRIERKDVEWLFPPK